MFSVSVQSHTTSVDHPPCGSGITGMQEDPRIIPIIPNSHFYQVPGPSDIDILQGGSGGLSK